MLLGWKSIEGEGRKLCKRRAQTYVNDARDGVGLTGLPRMWLVTMCLARMSSGLDVLGSDFVAGCDQTGLVIERGAAGMHQACMTTADNVVRA